ncbi:MAG: SDR family NAD(P)-dependent oxidoreductase [Chloroflexota bacterium]
METGLAGKSVIVTGGASNIGRGIALAFAKEGASVTIADIDEAQGEKTAALATQSGGKGSFVKCDVTHPKEAKAMTDACISHFGQIDVLVNNVGRPVDGPLTTQSRESISRQIDLNLIGMVNCIQAVLPHMISRKYGRIVNIGSEAGRIGDPKRPIYSACKGAVISLTKSVAWEVGEHGITVNVVCPHTVFPANIEEEAGKGSMFNPETGIYGRRILKFVQSPEAQQSYLTGHVIKRFGTPEDIAYAVVFLASSGASYITGQTLSVNGGHSML